MYREYHTLDTSSSKSPTTAFGTRQRKKKKKMILNDRSKEENRLKRTVRKKKKESRRFVDAARQVITRRVRKFFEIWQRRVKLREAYRFTKFKQFTHLKHFKMIPKYSRLLGKVAVNIKHSAVIVT